VDAKVNQLTEDERQWVQLQLAAAAQFVTDYGSERHPSGLDALDHAWASWLDRQSVDPEDPDTVINAVGVAFGQALVDAIAGFAWVIAEDADGTDLAVYGLPGAGDVLVYPANLVAKRYESREQEFLQAAHDAIVAEVGQLSGTTDG
jgi:Domain of unknown function (DUF3806)